MFTQITHYIANDPYEAIMVIILTLAVIIWIASYPRKVTH